MLSKRKVVPPSSIFLALGSSSLHVKTAPYIHTLYWASLERFFQHQYTKGTIDFCVWETCLGDLNFTAIVRRFTPSLEQNSTRNNTSTECSWKVTREVRCNYLKSLMAFQMKALRWTIWSILLKYSRWLSPIYALSSKAHSATILWTL